MLPSRAWRSCAAEGPFRAGNASTIKARKSRPGSGRKAEEVVTAIHTNQTPAKRVPREIARQDHWETHTMAAAERWRGPTRRCPVTMSRPPLHVSRQTTVPADRRKRQSPLEGPTDWRGIAPNASHPGSRRTYPLAWRQADGWRDLGRTSELSPVVADHEQGTANDTLRHPSATRLSPSPRTAFPGGRGAPPNSRREAAFELPPTGPSVRPRPHYEIS